MLALNLKRIGINSLFVLLAATSVNAFAADQVLHLDVKAVLDPSFSSGKLDGTVKFYFAGQSTPKVLTSLDEDTTNKKSNAFGKGKEEACKWVMLSALVALQDSAKARGANAVIGITSYYKKVEYKSASQYECHAGNMISGVALKGRYAKLASK
ncbi:MAG: excinuclease ATPase subunit [Arenimonas sp.]